MSDSAAPAAPKKRKLLKWLLIIIFALLIIGGGSYMGLAYLNNLPPFEPAGPTPEEIAANQVTLTRERYFFEGDPPAGSLPVGYSEAAKRLEDLPRQIGGLLSEIRL